MEWGAGDDELNSYFTSSGVSTIEIIDDNNVAGLNKISVECWQVACKLLSRDTFIANIPEVNMVNKTIIEMVLERINLKNSSSPNNEVNILFNNSVSNHIFFDGTVAATNVQGGEGDDTFQIGQLYNSSRTDEANVSSDDPIETVVTTNGYLSNGCKQKLTIHGGEGNDTFDILRNKCILDFKGDSGDDIFVSRAWVLHVPEVYDETLEFVGIDGGDGTDIIKFIGSVGDDSLVFEDDAIYGTKPITQVMHRYLFVFDFIVLTRMYT